MRTDRELLELAAKAAGYEVRWHTVWLCFVHEHAHNITNPPTLAGQRHVWIPLDDDGDALRLAVKLRIKFRYNEALGQALAWFGGTDDFEAHVNIEDCGRDENACARRAIVRAAAEIGAQRSTQAPDSPTPPART